MPPNWFIALPVAAGEWFHQLPPPPTGVRLFHPDDLHLTVAFLGPVTAEAAQRAFDLVQRWPTGNLNLTFGSVQPMGPPRRASAYAARIEQGHQDLAEAIGQIRPELYSAAGSRPDQRPPLPHVTLARPQRRATEIERQQGLAWAKALNLGLPEVPVNEIALYTWAPERQQRLFEIFLRRSLAPGAES
jgi:2'-5' RNA ligase